MTGGKAATVLFYVQHLLGIGHVFRAVRIARSLYQNGFDVHLVWGGTIVPNLDVSGLEVKYLTPARASDANFNELIHDDGKPFTDSEKENRKDELLSYYNKLNPDILITEAFPFGRRQMRFELVPLLEAATAEIRRPLVCASIRDIMQEGRREKAVQESLEAVKDWYDLVLVHGDPNFIRIEDTLQGASRISEKLHYTGLVTPDPVPRNGNGSIEFDVLVSAGGGAVGFDLMQVAINAMKLSRKYPRNWCLATGTELPENDFQKLLAQCPDGMRIVRYVPDTVEAMQSCKVSVSRSGYNTVADLLRADCAAILVPFDGGRETEQLKRAELMDQKGIAKMLHPADLSPVSLAQMVDLAEKEDRKAAGLDLEGARKTAEILLAEYKKRRS